MSRQSHRTTLQTILRCCLTVLFLCAGFPVTTVEAAPKNVVPEDMIAKSLPAGLSTADWDQVHSRLGASGVDVQQAYIKASNSINSQRFGYYLSLSGDTLAVGSPYEGSCAKGINGDQLDRLCPSAGAVYVFTRSGTTWTQQAYIKASNTQGNDFFGYSISLSGDTLAVGAYGEDSNSTGINGDETNNSLSNAGAVYVFTRSGTTWSQQAYIKGSNSGSKDQFGLSVSLDRDTLAVGAYGEGSNATGVDGNQWDNSAGNSGAAYVFTRSGSTWSQQAYIKASNTDDLDHFSSSIAVSGDTLAVGAYYECSNATGINGNQSDNSHCESGAVYVFTRSGTTWSQQAYIKASNSEDGDLFGETISLDGDNLAVGAINERSSATGINGDQADNSKPGSGAVYLFTRSGSTWSQQAYIKASNTGVSDIFGSSLSLSGDTLAVGAYNETSNASGLNGDQSNNSELVAGAVYLFTRSGTTWSQEKYIKSSNTNSYNSFGHSVSLTSNILAVGSPGESSPSTGVNGDQSGTSQSESGAAYIFSSGTWPTVSSTSLGASINQGASNFSVTFTKPVANFGSGLSAKDVTNPNNYLLVNNGANMTTDTVSCLAGVAGDDTRINVASVSYDSSSYIASVTLSALLVAGSYHLFVCGTTSIVDLAGNHLNGGTDSGIDFTVLSAGSTGGGTSSTGRVMPSTGFAPGMAVRLPDQPSNIVYRDEDVRLEIPEFNVDESVLGVNKDTGWNVTWLGRRIGYLEGTAFPTLPGNSVLVGHVFDADGMPGVFANLSKLKYGDSLIIHAFSQQYIYEVRSIDDWVPANDTRLMNRHETLPWLTLITCRGYNPDTHLYDWRTVVRGPLISVKPE